MLGHVSESQRASQSHSLLPGHVPQKAGRWLGDGARLSLGDKRVQISLHPRDRGWQKGKVESPSLKKGGCEEDLVVGAGAAREGEEVLEIMSPLLRNGRGVPSQLSEEFTYTRLPRSETPEKRQNRNVTLLHY